MLNMFPYVNLHKINLDWIITTVNNAVSTIQHSVRQIDAALDTVNGLAGRVTALETATEQLRESNSALQDRVSHAETQITSLQSDIRQHGTALNSLGGDVTALQDRVSHAETQITSTQSDLRQQGSTLDSLNSTVSALSTAVAGKVDNGGGTITGSANLLTVAGANSGEVVSIDGTSVTITGTGDNDVMLALDTAGEPGASESVLRLVRHDGTSPGPVRITNVGPGRSLTDAVNVGQIVPLALTLSFTTPTTGTWSGASWDDVQSAGSNGRIIAINYTSSDVDVHAICLPCQYSNGEFYLQGVPVGPVQLFSTGTWSSR